MRFPLFQKSGYHGRTVANNTVNAQKHQGNYPHDYFPDSGERAARLPISEVLKNKTTETKKKMENVNLPNSRAL
jgi:hypothetical protein